MSILIRGASLPKSCNECKLDLRTDICQAFCEWNAEHPYSIRATDRLPDCPLSEAPEPCEDTISRQVAIDALKICDNNEDDINCHKCPLRDKRWDGAWEDDETNCYTKLMRDSAKLLELPSAQPEVRPIDYQDCSNAMLKMWMDNVLTDGEYNKIMDKLNDFERKRREKENG